MEGFLRMNVVYNHNVLERFIPITYRELVENSLSLFEDVAEKREISEFGERLREEFHHKFYKTFQDLKYGYEPFNPDSPNITKKKQPESKDKFIKQLSEILNQANFEKLSEEKLQKAFENNSIYGVNVTVDFEKYSYMKLYYKGTAIKTVTERDWRWAYLKERERSFGVFKRIFMVIQPKDDENSEFDSHKIYLKSFKEIPENDLEMLFPNSQVGINLFDKIKLIVLGGGGTVGGIMPVVTKIVTFEPMVVLSGIVGLGVLIWRQVKNVFYQRNKYMMTLANNLYFHNLDNNRGSIMNLLDLAESEESKETFLSYIFIYKHKEISRENLDMEIEKYIFKEFGVKIDFEIDDAIRKLKEWELVRFEDGVFKI
jgi:hypothetical protein